MTSITVRQAELADLGAVVIPFDGYRQFDGQPTWPGESSFTPAAN